MRYFQASGRLLRKADQIRALLSVCEVFWASKIKQEDGNVTDLKDEKKICDVFKKVCSYQLFGSCIFPRTQYISHFLIGFIHFLKIPFLRAFALLKAKYSLGYDLVYS